MKRALRSGIHGNPPTAVHWAPDVLPCHGTPQSDRDCFLEPVVDGPTRLTSPAKVAQCPGGAIAALVKGQV